jgi:hypothetical protein
MNKKIFLLIGALLSTAAFAEIEQCDKNIHGMVGREGWTTTGTVDANMVYTPQTDEFTATDDEAAAPTSVDSNVPFPRGAKHSCTWSYRDENNQLRNITFSKLYKRVELAAENPSGHEDGSAERVTAFSHSRAAGVRYPVKRPNSSDNTRVLQCHTFGSCSADIKAL